MRKITDYLLMTEEELHKLIKENDAGAMYELIRRNYYLIIPDPQDEYSSYNLVKKLDNLFCENSENLEYETYLGIIACEFGLPFFSAEKIIKSRIINDEELKNAVIELSKKNEKQTELEELFDDLFPGELDGKTSEERLMDRYIKDKYDNYFLYEANKKGFKFASKILAEYLYRECEYEKAMQILQKCIETREEGEDTLDIQLLGRLYLNGRYLNKDFQKALEYFESSMENARSAVNAGYMYFYGLGCDVNITKAWEAFVQAQKLGDLESNYFLGRITELGLIEEADCKKAENFYFRNIEIVYLTAILLICSSVNKMTKDEVLKTIMYSDNKINNLEPKDAGYEKNYEKYDNAKNILKRFYTFEMASYYRLKDMIKRKVEKTLNENEEILDIPIVSNTVAYGLANKLLGY